MSKIIRLADHDTRFCTVKEYLDTIYKLIEDGEIDPTKAIVVLVEESEEGDYLTNRFFANMSQIEAIAILFKTLMEAMVEWE